MTLAMHMLLMTFNVQGQVMIMMRVLLLSIRLHGNNRVNHSVHAEISCSQSLKENSPLWLEEQLRIFQSWILSPPGGMKNNKSVMQHISQIRAILRERWKAMTVLVRTCTEQTTNWQLSSLSSDISPLVGTARLWKHSVWHYSVRKYNSVVKSIWMDNVLLL